MTRFLQIARALCLLSGAACLLAIGWTAYRLPATVSREADKTRELATVEALEIRRMIHDDVLPQVNFGLRVVDDRSQQALVLVQDLGRRADAVLATTEADANRQTSAALAIVKDAAANAVTEVRGLHQDLKPTLVNAALITRDAQVFLDEHYFDLSASVQSSTVAITSIARMGDELAKAAPKMAESTVGIGHSADGIAADVHTATSDFVKPRTFWQRVKGWVELGAKIGTRVL